MTELTKARTEDLQELISTANEVFTASFSDLHPKLYGEGIDTMRYHHIVKEDGKIRAIVGSFPTEMDILGEKLKVAGIGTVSVHKECRSKGYMKKLMAAALEEMEQEQVDFAYLGGQRQRYEYFSFASCGVAVSFDFTQTNARHLGLGQEVFRFEKVSAEDNEVIDQMFSLYQKKPAKVLRPREDFYNILLTWEATPEAIYRGDDFVGYLVRDKAGNGISELELLNPGEVTAVLADYLKAYQKEEVSVSGVFLYETEKIRFLSDSAEGFELSNYENYNVFNYRRVLEAFLKLKNSYEPLCDGELTVEIEDRQTVKIAVKNQEISVEELKEPNGEEILRIPHLKAMQVFFGAASYLGDGGVRLPAFARQWFPLPLFYSNPDQV